MLKSTINNQTWLVQQPHHAQISGFLAANWGARNGFARPGGYPGATHPALWRDEVVLGIAEHDNGWWEAEAMPRISARDGLPVGVGEAAVPTAANEFSAWSSGGFDRWRLGIDRVSELHPYAALLISLHAYWLYAVAFEDLTSMNDDSNRHFVFGAPEIAAGLVGDPDTTRAFLHEQQELQHILKSRVACDPDMAAAIEPDHLHPHVRLLQLLDSLSLFLALNDDKDYEFPYVPRASAHDTCSIFWRRDSARTIVLDPYPFEIDPLPVPVPARIVPAASTVSVADEGPLVRLHREPLQTIDFTFASPQSLVVLNQQAEQRTVVSTQFTH